MSDQIDKFFYKSQRDWITDNSPLKIVVKSRQTGFSWCNCSKAALRQLAAQIHDALHPP